MAEIPGITGGDPARQSAAVQSAVIGITGLSLEDIKSEDLKTAISDISSIAEIVRTYQPKIYSTIEKLSSSIDSFVDKFSGSIDLSIKLPEVTSKEQLKSFSRLISFMSSDKNAKRLRKTAENIYGSLNILAKTEPQVKAINAVVDSLTALSESLQKLNKTAFMSAAAIAAIGLSVFGVAVLFATKPEALLMFAVAMTAIGGSLWLFNTLVKEKELILTAAAIGIFGLSIWAITELLTGDAESIKAVGMFAIAMTAIGGAIWLFNKLVDPGRTIVSALALAAVGLSVGVLGFGMQQFKDIELTDILITAGSVVAIGGAYALAGLVAPQIILGSVAMGVAALSVWGLSKAVESISKIDISYDQLAKFGVATAGIMAAMILIGNPLTLPLVISGAAQVAMVSGATIALAYAFKQIEAAQIPSNEKFDNFQHGASSLVNAFATIGNPLKLPLVLVGVAQAAAVTAATVAIAAAIFTISKLTVPDAAKFDGFKYGVEQIGETFANIGGPVKLAKITAGAGIMTLVSSATVLIGGAITLFSNIISDPGKVQSAVDGLGIFIDGTVAAFTKFETADYAKVSQGIVAFSGISNMVTEMTKSVKAIGNLTFEEKELKDGKLVTTGVRKLTPDDFKKVGESIGMIISSLTEPLAAIADEKSGIIFKKNKVEKGIKALSDIGSVFMPLTDIITVFADKSIDEQFVTNFNKNAALLVQGTSAAFIEIDVKRKDIRQFDDAVTSFGRYLDVVSDPKLDKNILKNVRTGTLSIKDTINDIQLDKLTTLNDLMVNIRELDKTEVLKRLAEAFESLAEALAPKPQTVVASSPGQQINNTNTVQKEIINQNSELLQLIESGNADVVSTLRSLLQTVQGTLKVKMQSNGLI
jgi:hypothetical protein